jgi:hypothetical protein
MANSVQSADPLPNETTSPSASTESTDARSLFSISPPARFVRLELILLA